METPHNESKAMTYIEDLFMPVRWRLPLDLKTFDLKIGNETDRLFLGERYFVAGIGECPVWSRVSQRVFRRAVGARKLGTLPAIQQR
jgi:hypothetical protein